MTTTPSSAGRDDAARARWPLVVRVAGGRLDHYGRLRDDRQRLELACGRSTDARDLDNRLAGTPCKKCMQAVRHDLYDAAVQRREQREAAWSQRGQDPLAFPLSDLRPAREP
ncbi:hypothetical protein [Streptomyces mobaraensis]|uniref:hypothetical protein n=1 Tax=Streptomyces mobaraensis TaxID=35621 RepID=UPI0012ACF561|nr:hypothetical protein [Streptomyces mobaraensis]